jgi:hypothetical protein
MSEYAQRFADNDIDIDVLNGDSKINGLCVGLDRLSDLHIHEHDRHGCATVSSGALTRTWETLATAMDRYLHAYWVAFPAAVTETTNACT